MTTHITYNIRSTLQMFPPNFMMMMLMLNIKYITDGLFSKINLGKNVINRNLLLPIARHTTLLSF